MYVVFINSGQPHRASGFRGWIKTMAYMSQEKKKSIHEKIKPLLKEYGVKATMSVEHSSTLNLNIKSAKIDFIENYNEQAKRHDFRIREGYLQVHQSFVTEKVRPWFTGAALEFLQKAIAIMNEGNHDRSDSQSDYYDVGWYSYINIGSWERGFIFEAANE